ncbi:unnamed protein product [Gongylonema pulchrum]|uniref:Uncharacterized protein n=1 Tax=Gongylonema pulchrum TaxID=637853 RepID=A0A3P6SP47_9BILA|nr:unnamed protein product [Gongylonema pulchrum]
MILTRRWNIVGLQHMFRMLKKFGSTMSAISVVKKVLRWLSISSLIWYFHFKSLISEDRISSY